MAQKTSGPSVPRKPFAFDSSGDDEERIVGVWWFSPQFGKPQDAGVDEGSMLVSRRHPRDYKQVSNVVLRTFPPDLIAT